MTTGYFRSSNFSMTVFGLVVAVIASVLLLSWVVRLLLYGSSGTYDTFVSSSGKRIHLLTAGSDAEMKTKSLVFDRLARDMDAIVGWCVENAYPNEPDARRLERNWRAVDIHETTHTDHVAYVVDKNRDFKLCITTTEGGRENENTMRFVVIHEMAHMMSETYGHNDEFHDHFIDLLRVANHLKLYAPEMFSINPMTYCGTTISVSPCETESCTVL